MADVKGQVHTKFKVFSGVLAKNHTLGHLPEEIADFVRKQKIAPKSIGAEYVESAKKLVVTLGYRDDEPAYAVRLRTVALGKLESLDDQHLAQLAHRITAAAGKIDGVICHELFITEDHECLMLFMQLDEDDDE